MYDCDLQTLVFCFVFLLQRAVFYWPTYETCCCVPKSEEGLLLKKTCLTFKEFAIPRLHLIPGECVACFKAFCASVGIRGFVFFCEFTARRKLNAQSATFTMELYPSACSPATSAVDRNQSGYKYNSVPLTVVNIFTNNNIIMSKLCLNL